MTLSKVIADLEAAIGLTGKAKAEAYVSAYDAADDFFQGSLSLPIEQALPIWQALSMYLDDANEKVRILFQDAEQAKGEDR
jgi:hypothetical protein